MSKDIYTKPIFEIINESDYLEIDDTHGVRYFGLDDDVESDEDIAMHIEVVDNEYQKYEYFFSVAELKEAEYNPHGHYWLVSNNNREEIIKLKFLSFAPTRPYADLIREARDQYACNDIQIDDDADVRPATDAVWVAGWLWVANNSKAEEKHG